MNFKLNALRFGPVIPFSSTQHIYQRPYPLMVYWLVPGWVQDASLSSLFKVT